MMGLAPGIPSGAEAGVYALLALIGTPQATESKKRLDALVKARDEAVAAQEKANTTLAKATKEHEEADKLMIAAKASTAVNEAKGADLKQRTDALNKEKAALSADISARENTLAVNMDNVKTHQASLSKRESEIGAREKAADDKAAVADAIRAQYAAKLAQFKAIAG